MVSAVPNSPSCSFGRLSAPSPPFDCTAHATRKREDMNLQPHGPPFLPLVIDSSDSQQPATSNQQPECDLLAPLHPRSHTKATVTSSAKVSFSSSSFLLLFFVPSRSLGVDSLALSLSPLFLWEDFAGRLPYLPTRTCPTWLSCRRPQVVLSTV